jgi:hypothetical protein
MSKYKKGGILGGLIGFFAILAACLVFLAVVFANRVRVTERPARGETRLETPFGSLSVRHRAKLDPAVFGLPTYPGARRLDDSRNLASFELDFADVHKDLTVAAAEYETRDSIAEVEAFYRERLPGARARQSRGERVVLEVEGGVVKKMVVLRQRNGATRISLASVTDAAAN